MKMPEYVVVKIMPDKKGTSYSLEVVADAVNVKHGHWIIKDVPGTCWYRVTCSECGENVTSFANIYVGTGCGFNYCPECGAKMDEVTE